MISCSYYMQIELMVRSAKGSWIKHVSFRGKFVIAMKNINKLDSKNIDNILVE
ncbi:MAG: hypothetical protein IH852_13265 [Bacteroidetes bacterium]|nr:hypothetical protein [Bacteroidota bacterium]